MLCGMRHGHFAVVRPAYREEEARKSRQLAGAGSVLRSNSGESQYAEEQHVG